MKRYLWVLLILVHLNSVFAAGLFYDITVRYDGALGAGLLVNEGFPEPLQLRADYYVGRIYSEHGDVLFAAEFSLPDEYLKAGGQYHVHFPYYEDAGLIRVYRSDLSEAFSLNVSNLKLGQAAATPLQPIKTGYGWLIQACVLVFILCGGLFFLRVRSCSRTVDHLQVRHYVLNRIHMGYTKADIMKELLECGWTEDKINEVLKLT
ncbi:MAG: hypothetical protein ABH879_02155 [archaeon]